MKMTTAVLAALLCVSSGAWGQSTVRTQPFGTRTSVLSGTIAVTDTFQSIQVANSNRLGCYIQNSASNSMWVYFGPIASATKAASILVTAGNWVSCYGGAVVLQDQISITGTSTDTFVANVQ